MVAITVRRGWRRPVVAITVRRGWRRPVVAIRIWRRERRVGMMMVGMRALAAVPAVVITTAVPAVVITAPIGPAAAALRCIM